jgi:SulP family sulfate permease
VITVNVKTWLPFLRWLPPTGETLKADLPAGVSVALVLVPQSMAYAQLAGLPAYYGLYAAFLPGILAAMWGSSAQLATGPVAVVSLLTASGLAPYAATGSESFIALAILMAFLVGLIQLGLGLFKLGVVVNFLSHPVIVGFTNAAALIIGLSQLNKLFGVSMGRSEHFVQDVWGVLLQVGEIHLPTLLMGVSAFAIMSGLKRFAPRLPGVLVAVAIMTAVSWAVGFEHDGKGRIEEIMDPEVRLLAGEFAQTEARIAELNQQIGARSADLLRYEHAQQGTAQHAAALRYEVEVLKLELKDSEAENRRRARVMRKFIFERVAVADGRPARLYLQGQVPPGERADGYRWRIKRVSHGDLKLVGGGEVVGAIPAGLPAFALPRFSLDMMMNLLSTALVISLVGFMEAISIAKAMAAKTKERIDPNQELIGQGIGNIVGSFTQAYPVSGSFSRSAVNLDAGARTGLSSVFAGAIVLATLLFLTPLLYHLPQAVLAAVIMMAVIGLINFKAMKHAWKTHRHDGVAAVVTFLATLAFAPHLDNGIMVGAGLAILLYLYRSMTPRVDILGHDRDGTVRDARIKCLLASGDIIAIRYNGSLYFANVPYFENVILDAVSRSPRAKHLLIVADGINQIDASGEEAVHQMVARLRDNGIRVCFSGLKKQVVDVLRHSGLLDYLGQENLFPDKNKALDAIYAEVLAMDPNSKCALVQ